MKKPQGIAGRALLAVGLCAGLLQAQDYSRHCQGPDQSEAMIVDGTYEGTWEMGATFQVDLGGTPLVQTIKGNGTFKLKVDRGSFSVGQAANRSSLEGDLKTSTKMNWSGPGGGTANQNLNGQAPLKLDGQVDSDRFKATAEHHTSGSIQVTAPMYSSSQGQSLFDTVTLTFIANQGNCDGASGDVESDSVKDMIESMTGAGYSVTRDPWTWRMTRVPEDGDPVQKFKSELEKRPPANIHRTREAESTRLGELADRIKKDEPESVRECLWQLWLKHVKQQYLTWAQEDIKKLRGYKGDIGGLKERISRALETDRGLSLLGLDTCASGTHDALWQAMQTALSDHLQRMVDGMAPMERLLDLLRQATLLGVVSPTLEQRTNEAIQAQAKKWADATFALLKSAAQAARARGVKPTLADPAVKAALTKALNAEKVAQLMGLDLTQVLDYARTM